MAFLLSSGFGSCTYLICSCFVNWLLTPLFEVFSWPSLNHSFTSPNFHFKDLFAKISEIVSSISYSPFMWSGKSAKTSMIKEYCPSFYGEVKKVIGRLSGRSLLINFNVATWESFIGSFVKVDLKLTIIPSSSVRLICYSTCFGYLTTSLNLRACSVAT